MITTLTLDILEKIPKTKPGRNTPFNTDKIVPFIPYLNDVFGKCQINNSSRIAAFMAQTIVESACFTKLIENTNYTLQRAEQVWPNRFSFNPKSPIGYLQPINSVNVIKYQTRPDTIINRAYAGVNGNSKDEDAGDGLKYKGRGILQITGKSNYQACGRSLGLDLINHPELLQQPLYACRSAGWFWQTNNLNTLADNGNFTLLTKKINKGLVKLDDRKDFWTDFKNALDSKNNDTGKLS